MTIPSPSSPPPAKHRILVVDDEEIVLVGLRESLRRAGYEVVTGSDALAGLEALKTGPFAVVMTDQQMPWMTGLEFLAQVKEIQPDATRILITAVLSLETVVEAINKGEIYRFIIKPWLREELLATVTNAVQRFEMVRGHARLQESTVRQNERLTEQHRSLLQQHAALQEERDGLTREKEGLAANLKISVQLSGHVLQTFYPRLGAQARRVAEICGALAEQLNLAPEQKAALEVSSRLYDIGLVGVPPEMIQRWQRDPAGLSDAEQRLIEQHPALGAQLLAFAGALEPVGRIVRAHHERFDGSGYPDRLSGDRIPWLSRVLAVAIYYAQDYRSDAEAAEAVRAGSGASLDPEAVRALFRVLPGLKVARRERQVTLTDLRPGMVLAKGIYNAHGLLLVAENQPLSEPEIANLVNHDRLQPITQSLTVYC